MSGRHVPSFSVTYQHAGFEPSLFMTFVRTEKREAFDCLRSLARVWPNTTYRLKQKRKTVVRIEVREQHLTRAQRRLRARAGCRP